MREQIFPNNLVDEEDFLCPVTLWAVSKEFCESSSMGEGCSKLAECKAYNKEKNIKEISKAEAEADKVLEETPIEDVSVSKSRETI